MKGSFRVLLSILLICLFFSNASAEEKVSREQIDTLVARVVRTTLLQPGVQYIIKNKKDERDKLVCEYLSFKGLSDAMYELMKELPSSEFTDKISFAGSYVYFSLMSEEFWTTFRKYINEAENDKKFDYTIRDPQFAKLSESFEDDYPFLMQRLLKESVIPLYHTGIYVEKVLKIGQDKLQILFVKTLMEYFSYEEFVSSHAEHFDVCEMISSEFVRYSDILFGKSYTSRVRNSVLNDNAELRRLAEYMKLSRRPMYVSRSLYRLEQDMKLKQGQYTGEIYDGVPDGEGVLTDKKGVTYFGSFKDGLRHGPVFVTTPGKGTSMQFWYKGKFQKNIPTSLRADGSVPETVVIDGKRYGYGCYYNNVSKSTCVGFFVDGRLSGPGKIMTAKYTLNGRFVGSCVYDCVIDWHDTKYQTNRFTGTQNGILRKGVLHKVGPDGRQRVWCGEFVNDIADGDMAWCSMADKDTSRFYGLFAYGSMYGEGKIERTWVYKNGMREVCRYTGNTVHNKAYGEGTFEILLTDFPDDKFALNRYGVKLPGQYTEGKDTVIVKGEGFFRDNALVEGKVSVSNGNCLIGRFSDGKLTEGRMVKKYSDGSSYDGECLDGKYHGYGRVTYPDGIAYEGMFENGSPVMKKEDYSVPRGQSVNFGKRTQIFVFDDLSNKKGVASLVKAAGVKIIVRGISSVEVICCGIFKGDIMTEGKVTVSDGTWLEGCFEDGVLIKGKGKTIDKYGTVYTGEIKNGFPHGAGECVYSNGTTFKGNFAKGNRMDGVHYAADGKVIKEYK